MNDLRKWHLRVGRGSQNLLCVGCATKGDGEHNSKWLSRLLPRENFAVLIQHVEYVREITSLKGKHVMVILTVLITVRPSNKCRRVRQYSHYAWELEMGVTTYKVIV